MSGTSGQPSERDDLDQMGILTIVVPDAEHAQDLVVALEDGWACCASDAELPMTIVFLSPHNLADFAQLVRRVQAWLTSGRSARSHSSCAGAATSTAGRRAEASPASVGQQRHRHIGPALQQHGPRHRLRAEAILDLVERHIERTAVVARHG